MQVGKKNLARTQHGALDRLFGLRPGEAVRSLDQFIALVHPDDRAEVIRRLPPLLKAGGWAATGVMILVSAMFLLS